MPAARTSSAFARSSISGSSASTNRRVARPVARGASRSRSTRRIREGGRDGGRQGSEEATVVKEIIRTKQAPGSIAAYSQAVKASGLVFVSGQGPFDPTTGAVIG